jgi:M6 family metalloprotease-like protein
VRRKSALKHPIALARFMIMRLLIAFVALLSAATSVTAADAPPPQNVRTFRLAVVPVEFPDRAHDPRFSKADLEALLLSRGTYSRSPSGEAAFGSLADFYDENSSGRLKLEGRVFDWVKVRRKRAKLERTDSISQGIAYALLFPQALYALEAREGRDVLKGFDGVTFVVAGEHGPPKTVLWPHAAWLPWHTGLLSYYVMSEMQGGKFAKVGVHAHEFGHVLGILDKYGSGKHAGLGIWCTMAVGHRGDTANGDARPLHLCAWCKMKLGWLEPAVADPRKPGQFRLRGIEGRPTEALKVLIDPDGSEYFLLENRQKTGFDSGIPGSGLLIWHVGEVAQGLRNGVYFYSIDLEEAHGNETSAGPFKKLAEIPWPQPGRTAFTPWTKPGSTSWNLSALEVAITNIRAEGGDILFDLGEKVPGPSASAPAPKPAVGSSW